jgi:hypothetical protein
MITLLGSPRRTCDGTTRRETLKAGALSLLGGFFNLPSLLALEQTAGTEAPRPPCRSAQFAPATRRPDARRGTAGVHGQTAVGVRPSHVGAGARGFQADQPVVATAPEEPARARLLRELTKEDPAQILAFSPDGKRLALGSWGAVKILGLTTGKERTTLRGHRSGIPALAFSAEGKTRSTAGMDDPTRLWELNPEE